MANWTVKVTKLAEQSDGLAAGQRDKYPETTTDPLTPSEPTGVADARTWLFVPGNRPERFEKARASGADQVICDLEDAVDPEHKSRARSDVKWWLSHGGVAWVRINGVDTEWYDQDVSMLSKLAGLRGFVVPKAEVPAALHSLGRRLGEGRGLVALIETARGVHRAYDIAECDSVDRVAFGSIDFTSDIGAEETDRSLLFARSTLVMASRVAGKPAPVDGVTTTLDDPVVLAAAANRARELGFGGKLCVHPAQLAPVAAAFQPSAEQIAWARDILLKAEQSGAGASAADGQLIDRPVIERARRILVRLPSPAAT
jgi:citrate lyase subunit beta/citryl-CoA lyase